MPAFKWEDHPEANTAAFNWDEHEPDGSQQLNVGGPSTADSAGRGLAQGASFGLRDEGAGALQSPSGALKEIANKFGAHFSDEDIEAYRRERDASRGLDNAAKEANPKSYLAGEIGGAVATSFVPGLGLAKGASLAKNIGQAALQGAAFGVGGSEGENIGELARDAAVGGAIGGVGGAAGYGLGKVIQRAGGAAGNSVGSAGKYVGELLDPGALKSNSAEIMAAAKNLGTEATPGMLRADGLVERLESNLAKSPSLLGRAVKDKQTKILEALANTGGELTEDASNLSPFQLGEKFKSSITGSIDEKVSPIRAVFDEVADSTKHIPLSEKSTQAVKRNIENLDVYRLTGGAGKPAQYAEMIPKLKTADQVKTAMTLLNNDISSAQGAEKQVLLAIKEKLSQLEKNSIMRAAIKQARTGAEGAEIGRDIVGDLREARTNYRQFAKDLSGAAENARLKFKGGASQFLDNVESIPSERIQDKFFNVENNRQLEALKKSFPEEFELLKQGKLRDIQSSAIDNSINGQGRFSTQRFLNEVESLNPEAKNMLFAGKTGKLNDLETLHRSMPRNFNPPGTASEQSWQNALYSNAKDIPNALLYKGLTSNGGQLLATNISQIAKDAPQILGKFSGVMQKAAQRGTQAVAATHFVLEQNNPEYREMIRKLHGEDDPNSD